MSAVGFVNPWLLVALPAVGVPVLIHFLTRPRPRVIRYPTLRFLIEAGHGRHALHRLRVVTLLALRCLAVAALALCFARPFLKEPGSAPHPGAKRRVVLLVDASMSMRAVRGGVPAFTKACAEAAEVLSGLEHGSQAGVIFAGLRPRPVLPAMSENIGELRKALAAARPTTEFGRPDLALAAAQRMLGEDGRSQAQASIYVFSDFQRTNWSAARLDRVRGATVFLRPVGSIRSSGRRGPVGSGRSSGRRGPVGTTTVSGRRGPVGSGRSRGPVVGGFVPNVAITSVSMSPPEAVAGEEIELAARVFNCTGEKRQEIVRLAVGDGGVGLEGKVSLRPWTSAQATFAFALPRAGDFPGTVELSADDLGEDNVRYFRVRVREALTVLVVSDSDPEDCTSAAFFVSTALSPSERVRTGLTVLRRESLDTDRSAIDRADVIVIVTPAALPGKVAEAVAGRVTDGCGLVCVLDGPTSGAVLGALSSASGGAISAPFRLAGEARSRGEEGEPLGESYLAGAVLEIFADPSGGGLAGVLFRRHLLTEVAADRRGEVLVYHGDGSAALALSRAGRGTAVFANLPLTMDGGNLVCRGVFPALMAELVRALRRSGETEDVTPGSPWELEVPLGRGFTGKAAPVGTTTVSGRRGPVGTTTVSGRRGPAGTTTVSGRRGPVGTTTVSGRRGPGEIRFRVLGPGGHEEPLAAAALGRFVRLSLPPARAPGHYLVYPDGGDPSTPAAVGVVNVDPRESDTNALPLSYLGAGRGEGAATVIEHEGELRVSGAVRSLWPALAALAAGAIAAEMLLLALWPVRRRRAAAQRPAGGGSILGGVEHAAPPGAVLRRSS